MALNPFDPSDSDGGGSVLPIVTAGVLDGAALRFGTGVTVRGLAVGAGGAEKGAETFCEGIVRNEV